MAARFGRVFSWGGTSWSRGTWWIGIGNGRLFLRAGWYDALFSERYGYYGFRLPLGFGWRLIGRTIPKGALS
jgi:hypothetical protein